MYAAAEGKSNIGIPQSVGKEFIGKDADTAPQIAAGIVFVAPDNSVLLLCRSAQEANYANHWALPGGGADEGESPWQAACRECAEEIGTSNNHAWVGEPTIVDEVETPNGMIFTTFAQPVRYRFTPEINGEHSGFVWSSPGNYPKPMHPQVARVLSDLFPESDDSNSSQKKYERRLERLIERRKGEEQMPQAQDAEWNESDHPRAANGQFSSGGTSSSSTSNGSSKYSSLKREDVYSTLANADDKGGTKAVKELAIEIASERPDLKESLKINANDLGVKLDFMEDNQKSQNKKENVESKNQKEKYSSGLKSGEYVPAPITNEQIEDAYENWTVPEGWFVHGRSSHGSGKENKLQTGNVIQMTDDFSVAEQYATGKGSIFVLAPSKDTDVIDLTTTEGESRIEKAFKRDFDRGMLPPELEEAISQNDIDLNGDDSDAAWKAVKSGFNPSDIVNSAEWYDTDVVNWLGDHFPGAFFKLSNKGGGVALDPSVLQQHEIKNGKVVKSKKPTSDSIAMDRDTVRRVDADGHMFVEMTPISKANVCDYYGKEIPDPDGKLNLEPDRIYKLYRDPEELARAAPSFAGKPLLIIHKPINAADHPREIVVGSIGDDVSFKAPYLMAPLNIWDAEAIALIESEEQRELSSAYRYRPDMTPGTVNGEAYDGVMRDISANHLALVRDGRAGSDCLVMDSALEKKGRVGPNGDNQQESPMKKKTVLSRKALLAQGAITAYLMPKLAQDAKVDVTPALAGVTSANFAKKANSIVEGIKKATAGKLAMDADIEDVVGLIDALKTVEAAEEEEALETVNGTDNMPAGGVREFLAGKLSAEDMKAYDSMMATEQQEAMDEDETKDDEGEEKKPPFKKDDMAKDTEEKKDMVTKTAMDAAINAVEKRMRENARAVRTAEDDVRPYIGNIAIACDSAEEVYRTALTSLGVDVNGVPPSAYKAILKVMPVPGSQRTAAPSVAMDAKSTTSFHALFPDAKTHVVKHL